MTSGFFLFPEAEPGKPRFRKPAMFLKKTAVLYGIAILLYLPLNIYVGTAEEWGHLPSLLKDIVFNGTFYHLWYLPAAITGVCISWLLLKKLKAGQAFIISLLLYIIGLFGDSYYGISEKVRFLKAFYQWMFLIFDYTRNGLFFAPVFFILGALLARRTKGMPQTKEMPVKTCLTGLAVCSALMLAEGLLLHKFGLQRHDSMYLMLLPCMFFLFRSLLLWKGKSMKCLRNLSMLIYLIHPAVIVAVRGFAKAVGLQGLLIDNSAVHFLAVSLGSFAAAVILIMLFNLKHSYKAEAGSIQLQRGPAQPHEYGAQFHKNRTQVHKDRAWAEINMASLRHNVKVLQEALPAGCGIMAVVKANAYGHGDAEVSAYLNRMGVNAFAVATVDEGIRLRRRGIKGEILILGYTPAARAPELFHYRLSQTVADAGHARELNRFGKPIRVHIKVDTGMHRLGEDCRHVFEIALIFGCRHLRIEGIFTHLSVPDSMKETDVAFTNRQIQSFYELLDKLRADHIQIPKTHIQSSYGVMNYPELRCGYARIGIALYGVLSTPDARVKCPLDLRPVLSLKSRVALVRTIKPGESVGYGREFVAREETKIAVISIGYADGFPRRLSAGKCHVLIGGRCAPVIGRICMDQLVADVTGLPDVKRGDVVTLIGKDGAVEITAEQAAANAGTITNELLSRLSGRLERVFLES